jgi:hypothetical protein
MYSDYNQLKQYDQYLGEKAQEYQNAQYDMAMVAQFIRRRANQLLTLLLAFGQLARSLSLSKSLKSRQL